MTTDCDELFATLVQREMARATVMHGPMVSTHEAHSVVREEFEEWWDEIKRNDPIKGFAELVQLAAMCHRAARDVYGIQYMHYLRRHFDDRDYHDLQPDSKFLERKKELYDAQHPTGR